MRFHEPLAGAPEENTGRLHCMGRFIFLRCSAISNMWRICINADAWLHGKLSTRAAGAEQAIDLFHHVTKLHFKWCHLRKPPSWCTAGVNPHPMTTNSAYKTWTLMLRHDTSACKITISKGLDPFSAELVLRLGNPAINLYNSAKYTKSLATNGELYARDLVSYLVLQTNPITSKQLKAHKSFSLLVAAWVKDVHACIRYRFSLSD